MRGKSILRPPLLRQAFSFRTISSSSSRIPLNQSDLIPSPKTPFFLWATQNPNLSRSFSDYAPDFFRPSFLEPDPPPVPENIIFCKSDEEFGGAMKRVEEESASAVFYFTSKSCVPCRFIGPVMEELARRTPDVIVYKMDIEEKELGGTVSAQNIKTVPTVQYYKEGKKEDEVVGGDATRIVQNMNKFYNMINPEPEDSEKEVKDSHEEVEEGKKEEEEIDMTELYKMMSSLSENSGKEKKDSQEEVKEKSVA